VLSNKLIFLELFIYFKVYISNISTSNYIIFIYTNPILFGLSKLGILNALTSKPTRLSLLNNSIFGNTIFVNLSIIDLFSFILIGVDMMYS
jgi:hypothetical protein